VNEPAQETTTTKPCYDCGTNLTVPFKFCVPATLEEQRQMADGAYVERPPLCYDCWVKRTGKGR
jgi:hypothetical protein